MQLGSALLHEKGFSAATEWFIPGINVEDNNIMARFSCNFRVRIVYMEGRGMARA